MRKELSKILAEHLRTELCRAKSIYGLTYEQMGEILLMSSRNFAEITKQEHSMSVVSLLLYLYFIADDPHRELNRLQKKIFSKIDENAPIVSLLRRRKMRTYDIQKRISELTIRGSE